MCYHKRSIRRTSDKNSDKRRIGRIINNFELGNRANHITETVNMGCMTPLEPTEVMECSKLSMSLRQILSPVSDRSTVDNTERDETWDFERVSHRSERPQT